MLNLPALGRMIAGHRNEQRLTQAAETISIDNDNYSNSYTTTVHVNCVGRTTLKLLTAPRDPVVDWLLPVAFLTLTNRQPSAVQSPAAY